MAIRREVRFEVVVEQGGKPNIDGIFADEKAATDRANYLLRLAKFPVVRVVKVNSAGREETVFQKASAGGGGRPTTISQIEEAAVCTDALQVFSFDSRMTLLRLLRGYWDDQTVVPAEQLHRYYPLRYFEREALLFNPAVNRLATLQAPLLGVKPTDRYDQIIRLFTGLKELAQQSAVLEPFDRALARGGVAGLLAAALDRSPEERDRIVTHAFGALLEPHRDWGAKLEAVLRVHEDGDAENTRLVDEFAAEVVDGREPIRALIGYAPDLGSALLSLLAALHGDLDDRLPCTDPLLALSSAIGGGGFARTREALLRRIRGGVEGLTPLTRTGSGTQVKMFQSIADRLASFDGYLGGPGMAEALVKRGKTVWAAGGIDLPFEDAVLRLTNRLGGPGARICFLLDLATSPFGRRKFSVLIPRVAEEFDRIGSAAELTAPGVTPQEVRDGFGRRLRAAGIPRALAEGLIAKITAIPDEKRVTAPLVSHSHETYDIRNPEPPSPKLVLIYQGRELVLQEGGAELVIGRATDCGIVLDHASASRRHLLVGVRGDGFVVEDLSRNGTCLIPAGGEPRLLRQGDLAPLAGRGEIVIGSTEIGEKPARIAWEITQKR